MLTVLATATACSGNRPPGAFTRDIGEVPVRCDPVRFIVSHNDDDDTGNGRPDRLRPIDPVVEDNLRRFDFDHPDAAQVYIAAPVLTANNEPAVGTRVRAYTADRTAAFAFGMHPVPVSMHLEGIRTSGTRDDIGFEYQYFRADRSDVCGGGAVGTVVDVRTVFAARTGGGTAFDRHRKLLITATAGADGEIAPADAWTTTWAYDGDAVLADPASPSTTFIAGLRFTPPDSIDRHLLRFRVREGGQVIEATRPVNLTAPRHLQADRRGIDRITGFLQPRETETILLVPETRIRYTILDQERQRIRLSAWAERAPFVRENILAAGVLTSPFDDARTWLRDNVTWEPNWRLTSRGEFGDRLWLNMPQAPFVDIVQGRRMFHAPLRTVGGVLVHIPPPATHQWEMSVDSAAIVVGTRNTFTSTVHATEMRGGGIQIRVRTLYTVVTP